MIDISQEQIQKQLDELIELSSSSSIIFFDDFIQELSKIYDKVEMPDEIKIAKSEEELIKGDFEPAYTINIKDNLDVMQYKGFPMWRNQSKDEFSLHGLGYIEGDKSSPSMFNLIDVNPHGNIGGATGHGKSVTGNAILIAASLVHPPWAVQYYLSDPKITELKPYAISEYKLPHVDSVAATSDPEYAISILEFVMRKMDLRASIFASVGVKNVKAFTQKTGLHMPMMVVVLDETKSMLKSAGKRAGRVSELIELFIAKARFAGGRCLILSQGAVKELGKDTFGNINIRMALGCTPDVSNDLIGNPGASVNLGSMGRIVYNDSPEKDIKNNYYLHTPFLPDEPNKNTNTIYEIFQHQQEVWEKLTYPGARISPLSFFDEEAPLKLDFFQDQIRSSVDMGHIFVGEPVYINKSLYPMAFINLLPNDKYSDNLGNNILFISSQAKQRLNFLATILANLDILREKEKIEVMVSSNLKVINDKISDLGYKVDHYGESDQVSHHFQMLVARAHTRIQLIKVDEAVFETSKIMPPNKLYEKIITQYEETIGPLSELMKKRIRFYLPMLDDAMSIRIIGLSGELRDTTSSINEYLNYVIFAVQFYKGNLCEAVQLTASKLPIEFRIFFNFHLLTGTEVKLDNRMDMWMNVVRMAPVYGVHFIIVTDVLPTSGSALNGVFNKIFFYYPTTNAIAQHKLADDYPSSTLPGLYIYADKTKDQNKCVKVKYVEALPEDEEG